MFIYLFSGNNAYNLEDLSVIEKIAEICAKTSLQITKEIDFWHSEYVIPEG